MLIWQLPEAPLRASVVTAKTVAMGALVCLAVAAHAHLPLGDLYAVKGAATFAVVTIVDLGFLHAHHPFATFGPGNHITTFRAALVSLLVALIGEPRLPMIAATAAVIGLTIAMLDGVDGWLARRSRMASDFGARFDMEVDALLIMALAILAWRYGKAGVWILLSGLLRYVFVAAGSFVDWLRRPLPTSRRRQAICVLQILSLAIVVMPIVTPPLSAGIAAAALAALCWSFFVDTVWLWRRAR